MQQNISEIKKSKRQYSYNIDENTTENPMKKVYRFKGTSSIFIKNFLGRLN